MNDLLAIEKVFEEFKVTHKTKVFKIPKEIRDTKLRFRIIRNILNKLHWKLLRSKPKSYKSTLRRTLDV